MLKEIAAMKIGIIGAGIMGRALIRGMLDADLVPKEQLYAAVSSSGNTSSIEREYTIKVAAPYRREWIEETDIFLICTKPHGVLPILKELVSSGRLKPATLIVSIAAGVTLTQMEAAIPNAIFIRAMPNTPCLIGAGTTVISPGRNALKAHQQVAELIFNSVGKCYRLAEQHLNAVTAVSGSGPAYIYLMMEALADGAVKVGLPREMALKLVSQTMLGSALMVQVTGKHPATLKDEVTTPSGCTISGLLTLEDGRIRSTLARAVEEATRIAANLG